ncbi:bifunctional phosphoribosyl-AMP cyclohydrolase/phosphoribosyl-ATP diphosphatase HisIE [Amphibacillus xylanus]|uniref:Histidine biosynthesis bifunctional protein HisIE n=1 Tax=Amphibacillus xylanus (strain ATCC 51415 / DSM 6626 / JCM 7361 / LMG 17667 / NBRC 15112 / Ep01) TaxID=698758 RepID=K0J7J4_AMPXN|nr:bifunctional phosphoribosyl-AMP cyclohydrolase/phosphoribosyl-ATP diphosphatase HisIE [Amphibacillus xylanus]BAM47473.1 phosphoribosyl-AMP cyclohydrolase/phosphoribosyl-ATP pyrophosphohydrolase [Amphibacillus xylanus NBRC 15112]
MKPDFSKGLVPAIVIDSRTKAVLMLAYMNEESYQKTLETNQTWFYSRSRQSLWNKGATSGNTQEVISIKLDCDQDTLLIEVIPNGPACHTGEPTCFYKDVKANDNELDYDEDIIDQLLVEIKERKQTRVAGSYTNYLFDKGVDKIGKKIIEEAGEVVIAAKNNDQKELILEVSDLLYHTFVMMEQQNVTIVDIKKELTRRFGKKGNNKGERANIEKW